MRSDEQERFDTGVSTGSHKKPYATPTLTIYGTFEKLTGDLQAGSGDLLQGGTALL